MGKKSSKPTKPETRGSKVLKILGLIVVLSFVLSPLIPDFVIGPPPTVTPQATTIPATVFSPTPTTTTTPTPTSSAPASPTPGQAPAPPSP